MEITVTDFMHQWNATNLHFHGRPTDARIDPVAESLVEKCVSDAEAEGLSLGDLEDQFGGLPAYIQGELERIASDESARNVRKEY